MDSKYKIMYCLLVMISIMVMITYCVEWYANNKMPEDRIVFENFCCYLLGADFSKDQNIDIYADAICIDGITYNYTHT